MGAAPAGGYLNPSLSVGVQSANFKRIQQRLGITPDMNGDQVEQKIIEGLYTMRDGQPLIDTETAKQFMSWYGF